MERIQSERLFLRISPELKKRLKERAKEKGMSASELARALIEMEVKGEINPAIFYVMEEIRGRAAEIIIPALESALVTVFSEKKKRR